MSKMNTIEQTFRICKENNVGISKNAIRQLAKQGRIPAVKIGNKLLINYDGLISFLNSNYIAQDTPNGIGITPIS